MSRSTKSPKIQQEDSVPFVIAKSHYFIEVWNNCIGIMYWNNQRALSSDMFGFSY